MEKFLKWLEAELQNRDWSPADLARRASLGQATIHKILNGDRKAGPDVSLAIARAMGEDPVRVFRLAGLLPPQPDPAPGETELLHTFRDLPVSQQVFFLRMVRGLAGLPGQLALDRSGPQRINEERRAEYRAGPSPAPDPEELMELFQALDAGERHLVEDFARWRLAEQHRRRDSSSRRRERNPEELQRLEQALDRLSSAERQILIDWALEQRAKQVTNDGVPDGK